MKIYFSFLLIVLASQGMAESRELDAHEHGVGTLNIAIDGNRMAMELRAPGADIVGFEYLAQSSEDRAAIDAALAALSRPLDLFGFPAAAACGVTSTNAALESEDDHGEHDQDAHDDHGHDEHAHDEHADERTHSEFFATYEITCGNMSAVTEIDFTYFDRFTNARELEVALVTASGAQAFEVRREDPSLVLRGMF